jgi:hypothetical protein
LKSTISKALFIAALCATAHAKELPATVPTILIASIDEWKGASYRVELAADGSINYFDNLSGRARRTRIRVPAERWVTFRRHLDSAKIWSWRREYIDIRVADGTGWRLQVAYADRRITSRGSNAYPPKKQFEEFRTAVQELTGGRRFE